ncbi:MAG: patatin-like phospholipase family protein [Clostridia bacterium]|nr:patatin-like phospholipase family protein [Clostridia bacterium]
MEKEYALILAGGGTRGAYQVGAWKALKDLDINVKAVMGTSIGSLNGALILQDDVDAMIDLYQNMELTSIMEINEKVDTSRNLFDIKNLKPLVAEFINSKGINNEPLRETINKYIDLDKIYKSKMDFGLVTYSIDNKAPLQLYKDQIPKDEFVDFLLASSCLPIFKAQKIGNFEFVDGAFYDNIPINMAIEKGYKNIIVIDINGTGFNRRMADKNVYLKVISPKEKLGGTMNFNKDRMKNNIALGYLDTMRSFNKMQGHIYYFYSKEFNRMLEVFNLQTIYGLENAAKIYEINKYKAYKFEEFIEEVAKKHEEAKTKYAKMKDQLQEKNVKKLRETINTIFNENLGICFVTDIYLDRPMSKRFDYLRNFIQDYVDSVEALLELESYLK